MRCSLAWIALGAALSSAAFLGARYIPSGDADAGAVEKPYLMIWDDSQVEYGPEDMTAEARELPARRSIRLAHQCGAKKITNRPPAGPDDFAAIYIPAGFEDQAVVGCIEWHKERDGIESRNIWLTDTQLIWR